MRKQRLNLMFLGLILALSTGPGSLFGQNSDMAKALEKIINAGPDKFEKLRDGKWEPATYGGTKAKAKVGIPGIDSTNCRLDDFTDLSYSCALFDQSAAQAQRLFDEIKAALPLAMPGWKFKDDISPPSGYKDYMGAPRDFGHTLATSHPVRVTYYCQDPNTNSCYVAFYVIPKYYAAADLAKNKAKSDLPKNKSKQAKQNKNAPPCDDLPGISNATLNIVTTVKPAANTVWKFPEAPSVAAARILQTLNRNTRNIIYQEASGLKPNLYIDVIFSQTGEGTQRITASADVIGLGRKGILFSASSGAAPFTSWRDAVDKLAGEINRALEMGWVSARPCRETNGTIRQ